jgi:malate dehydrogenase (oxaloacetate-decarboxylating)(NADP+)
MACVDLLHTQQGKLALYTACGGISPKHVLPVHLDVGTNNPALIEDPYYLGLKQPRVRGPEYDALVSEFFESCMDKFGDDVLIQFEDFGNVNAFRLLEQWQDRACCFNDDIQGTASVALAGLLASERVTGTQLKDHIFLFSGAGEAGTGIAELIAYAIAQEDGTTIEDARKKIFMVDSRGLITKTRWDQLQHHKKNFAHDGIEDAPDFLSAMDIVKPSVIIGVSAQSGSFNQDVCEKMASLNEQPIIFALSNPTSKAECTAEQAYQWTDGKCLFASGSPFDPVTLSDGRRFVPGQGNNAYVFPGIGLGSIASRSTRITTHDMYIAATSLAQQVKSDQLNVGCLYPPLEDIREVSAHIAVSVVKNARTTGVARASPSMPLHDDELLEYVKKFQYDPFEDPWQQELSASTETK